MRANPEEYQGKRLKPVEPFIKEDAPFRRSHAYKLINSGEIKTVRIGKRRYVDMVAWRLQEAGLPAE